jgi:hypothetical protein
MSDWAVAIEWRYHFVESNRSEAAGNACVGGGIHDSFDHSEDQGPLHYYEGQRPD